MKILKITFQNLNSLQGEHSIDLENGLLGEAGIFAITGPTGAGKSTILDAITLALFGKAARYEKESNPGEMMTRGTGECAAEVLFECSKGRFTAKWTRSRARKKSDGNLQNPKREIAKANTGEILAEKLKEADLLIESLTGLDYDRFLRSVLLAQGRFKEFLDAGDNERGELLEKITGTEIYSRISKKAYETEREHDNAIQAAKQKLGGVELKSEEELETLKVEKSEKDACVERLKQQLDSLQTKLQSYEKLHSLNAKLEQSNADLLQWQAADQAFAPARKDLEQHEATQPFQPAVIELESQQRQHVIGVEEIAALIQNAKTAQLDAAQWLTATSHAVNQALRSNSTDIDSNTSARKKLAVEADNIATWLLDNQSDLKIESLLPELRTLGESARLAGRESARLQREQVQLEAELQKNAAALSTKKESVAKAQQALEQSKASATQAEATFKQAAEAQSLEAWRSRVSQQSKAVAAAEALGSQRTYWSKAQATCTRLSNERPALAQELEKAQQTVKSQNAAVLKETDILEDKRKIYEQAQLIATLEDHRLKLKPDEACPLCGALEHPYANHLESTEDDNKQAVDAQKKVLLAAIDSQKQAEATLTRLQTSLKSLDKSIAEATTQFNELAAQVSAQAQAAAYTESLADDAAFNSWLEQLQLQCTHSEQKLAQLDQLELSERKAKDRLKDCLGDHQLCTAQLTALEQKQTELSSKQQSLTLEYQKAQEAIDTQLAAFNKALSQGISPVQSPSETQTRCDALEQKLRDYKAKLETQLQLKEQDQAIETKLKDLAQIQQRLKEELATWTNELTAFSDVPASDRGANQKIAATESQRRSDCQAALLAAQRSQQALEQKQNDLTKLAQQIQTASEALLVALQPSKFDTIESLKAARLSDSQFQTLNQQKAALKTQHDKLTGSIESTQQELKKLAASGAALCSGEVADLKSELTTHDKQIALHNQRIGEIKLLFLQDSQARASHAELIQQIEALAIDARPWIELNALIGSASGDKFSKFAQGLTLAQLLQLANQQLLKLNDRYYIQRTPESELSLQIVDRYQADAIRPTRSLSGGESFLVSLALALGLSDLAGSDTRIESLFIDEGFGTLDSDTLDTALAALENLRTSNRTIGIISHVEALKHRISAQIRVSKASNGHGTLEIINGP